MSTIQEHEEETENLSESPAAVKYVENYYAKGRGKQLSLDDAKHKVDTMSKHIHPQLKAHIKKGIELRREKESREREGVTYTSTSHKTKSGKFQKVWRDVKGRFTKSPS